MTSFEFQQSGLLNALVVLLTKSSSQAMVERKKHESKGNEDYHEMRNTDKIEMAENQSQLSKEMTQKDAQNLILRLMLFAHAVAIDLNGHLPIMQLISQCH